MRTFLIHPNGEWLMDVPVAVELIVDAMKQLKLSIGTVKVLLPGIGKSELAFSLYQAGMVNLTLWDIEQEALTHQRQKYETIPSTVKIQYWDALTDSHIDPAFGGDGSSSSSTPTEEKYDIIIDKSFMDVFLRQGQSTKVIKRVQDYLRPDGYYFAISMFHAKWKRMLPVTHWDTVYTSIAVPRYSRTRPTVVSYYSHAAVFFSKRISNSTDEEIERPKKKSKRSSADPIESTTVVHPSPLCINTVGEYKFSDFKYVTKNAMPVDASFY